ncbi:unnamed protein product [Psylliodes chrysocephalus]|uniref:Uncharacterized protein n=1 Tax=Psylliodes chrysocephalus TaxID=3402493 RepID=A0A9P0GDR0_9CUCU|nr:unnamed protein product [Psylliodes chrysocephala]
MDTRNRKTSIKGEEELHNLHTIVKTLVTTLCTSDEFISTLIKTITESLNDKFKKDFQSLKDENKQLVKKLQNQDQSIKNLINRQEIWDRSIRNRNLIFYGIKENEGERCTDVLMDFFMNKMKLKLENSCIESCFRLERKVGNKDRPVMVKFSVKFCKDLVFKNKKLLKQTKIVIREDLSQEQQNIIKETLKKVGSRGKVWTMSGNIFLKLNDNEQIIKINELEDTELFN